VLLVPATAALLSALFAKDISLPVAAIAGFVLTSVLLPLAAGVAAGTWWPGFASRAAPICTIVAYVILVPVVVLALWAAGPNIFALYGHGAVLAIVVTVAAGLAAGHWLGGPEPLHRMALAEAAATRHPGIAGLIAHRHFDDPRVTLAVLLFLLTSMVVTTIYLAWAKRRLLPATLPPAKSGIVSRG
jgi:BASS family bile acid:Na+ symporter